MASFLDLPAELRLEIYRMVVPPSQQLQLAKPNIEVTLFNDHGLSILGTNRLIRQEAKPVIYGEHEWVITVVVPTYASQALGLKSLPQSTIFPWFRQNACFIRYVTIVLVMPGSYNTHLTPYLHFGDHPPALSKNVSQALCTQMAHSLSLLQHLETAPMISISLKNGQYGLMDGQLIREIFQAGSNLEAREGFKHVFWSRVERFQCEFSTVLQPLLLLPSVLVIRKGDIKLGYHVDTAVADLYGFATIMACRQAFMNCLEAVIKLRLTDLNASGG